MFFSTGCMVLYHPTITPYTKSLLVRSVFQTVQIEIEVLDKTMTVVYFAETEKERILQTTMELESSGIYTVYAFEETKEEALRQALAYLEPFLAEKGQPGETDK